MHVFGLLLQSLPETLFKQAALYFKLHFSMETDAQLGD